MVMIKQLITQYFLLVRLNLNFVLLDRFCVVTYICLYLKFSLYDYVAFLIIFAKGKNVI